CFSDRRTPGWAAASGRHPNLGRQVRASHEWSPYTRSMLCGRDRELRMVVRLLEDARAGRSGVLAVVGEAGIGKSALLGYAEEQAAGVQVLRALGVPTGARIPSAGQLEL